MTLERFARAAGFSQAVSKRVARTRRSSSLRSYQAKWGTFRACRSHGHTVSNPTIPKIADFLLWLWEEKKLSLSAVRGYRSMLSLVFMFKLPSIGQDFVLRDLIRSFSIDPPRAPTVPLAWDVNVVLRHLTSQVYEPLS